MLRLLFPETARAAFSACLGEAGDHAPGEAISRFYANKESLSEHTAPFCREMQTACVPFLFRTLPKSSAWCTAMPLLPFCRISPQEVGSLGQRLCVFKMLKIIAKWLSKEGDTNLYSHRKGYRALVSTG